MVQSSSQLLDLTGLTFPKDTCIVIIRTEWNAPIVDLLEEGTIKILNQNKIAFILITVPGAFELGFAIKSYWENHQYKSSKIHAFISIFTACSFICFRLGIYGENSENCRHR